VPDQFKVELMEILGRFQLLETINKRTDDWEIQLSSAFATRSPAGRASVKTN
jgi:hypothetical protein